MSDAYWKAREERYQATMAACRETAHAFKTYHWTDPESAIRSAYTLLFHCPAPASWSDALAAIARIAPPIARPTASDPAERVAPLGEPAAATWPDEWEAL